MLYKRTIVCDANSVWRFESVNVGRKGCLMLSIPLSYATKKKMRIGQTFRR